MFDPARGYPSVVPYFRYSEPEVGRVWLTEVLGATEALRLSLPDGRTGHAEFRLGTAVISIGLALRPPAAPALNEDRQTLRQMTLVFVNDLDDVVRRAQAHGGTVVDQPTEHPWGLRQAILRDPEGYLWEPAVHVRDVEPSAWGAHQMAALPG